MATIRRTLLAGLVVLSLALPAWAQQELITDVGTLGRGSAEKAFQKPPYSPYAGRHFPTRPFFGDMHVHTSFSMDAGAFGARLGPKDAYRLAEGQEIRASSGQLVKLSRPLDFLTGEQGDQPSAHRPNGPRAPRAGRE
jgi:hypothetical protein